MKMTQWSAVAILQAIERKEVSVRELVEVHLKAIATEPYHAFLEVMAAEALQEADVKDQQTTSKGVLHGLPVAVKDLIDVKGYVTTNASAASDKTPAPKDATVVRKLKQAGAILIGKTNLHEYAFGGTSINAYTGTVHNPWNQEYIAGGSSGGSAAAVAGHLVPVALGTDTGGSIRMPASACGIVGLKPTFGRVSKAGVTPLGWSLDHVGPMTRSVADAFLLYDVLQGYDAEDRFTWCAVAEKPLPDRPWRIAFPKTFFQDGIDPEVASVQEKVQHLVAELGWSHTEIQLPNMEELLEAQSLIVTTEAYASHRQRLLLHRDRYGKDVAQRLLRGEQHAGFAYMQTVWQRQRWQVVFETLFSEVDLLCVPTLPITVPTVATMVKDLEEWGEAGSELRRFTAPFNLLGLPVLSLPAGQTASGLPIGVQLVAPAYQEAWLKEAALSLEAGLLAY